MKVSDFIISICEKLGITEGFSLVGGMAMHINRSVSQSKIGITYCNHEQAVIAAVEGYVKADNYERPGLAIVTSGPGVTNTITSLTSAYYDSVPLFLVSGQVKTTDINKFSVRSYGAQEVPHIELLKSITKISFQYDPQKITLEQLASNLALAMQGRKGPVHIDIPLDIQSQDSMSEQDVDKTIAYYNDLINFDTDTINLLPDEMLDLLKKSNMPVCVIGNALKIASIPRSKILDLVNNLGIPCLFTWASMDLLNTEHPLNFGCPGGLAGTHSNKILQKADFIIFLGTRLDLLTTGYQPENFGKAADRFLFECDPNEISKFDNFKKLKIIKSDIRPAVKQLSKINIEFDEINIKKWIDLCNLWKIENDNKEKLEFSTPSLNCYHIADLIANNTSTNYVVPTASGFAIEGFARFYKPTKNSTFSWAGHVLGSMGLALPSAIGASVRRGECVTCVDGDGGFLLNMQELYTLKANSHLAIAIFILNNNGYASISNSQKRAFGGVFGADSQSGLSSINFEQISQLADLKYFKCTTLESLKNVVETIRIDSRILVDIQMQDDGYRGPSITTKFDDKGIPYSTQLEDIDWR